LLDCALISPDEGFRHAVLGLVRQPKNNARVVLDLQTYAASLDRASLAKVRNAKPSIGFVDLGLEPSSADGIRILSREVPELTLVVAGPALDAEGILAVMRAGAREYLPRPISQPEVEAAFQRVRRRARTTLAESVERDGRVSTVFSAKGGTGVTTVASNLAAAIRMLTKKKVLLIDLSPSLGTAAIAMGVQPRYSYLDVIQNFHRLDEGLLQSFLEVDDSGVHVLASPQSGVAAESPTTDEVLSLIDLTRQLFDFVVVDGGNALSNHLEPLLQTSDECLLVVTADLAALRNLRKASELHGRINGRPPPKLVLNQYKEGIGLSARDVEDGMGQRIDLILDKDDLRMWESVNVGRPEVLVGRSRFAKDFMGFVRRLVGPGAVATPRRKGMMGWFSRSSGASEKGKKEAK
jgi:pilus assembly protein CpaE